MMTRRAIMAQLAARGLPSGYRRLEYLESTGTQYIDTGLVQTPYISASAEFKSLIDNNSQGCFFGTLNSVLRFRQEAISAYSAVCRAMFYSNIFYWQGIEDQYIPETPDIVLTAVVSDSVTVTANIAGRTTTCAKPDSTPDTPITYPVSMYVFAQHNTNGSIHGATEKIKTKMYYLRYFELEDKKLDMIPALRISDNKPGMWDKVTRQFFTNAGTGEFLYA